MLKLSWKGAWCQALHQGGRVRAELGADVLQDAELRYQEGAAGHWNPRRVEGGDGTESPTSTTEPFESTQTPD